MLTLDPTTITLNDPKPGHVLIAFIVLSVDPAGGRPIVHSVVTDVPEVDLALPASELSTRYAVPALAALRHA
jgi:hypothetical protein